MNDIVQLSVAVIAEKLKTQRSLCVSWVHRLIPRLAAPVSGIFQIVVFVRQEQVETRRPSLFTVCGPDARVALKRVCR